MRSRGIGLTSALVVAVVTLTALLPAACHACEIVGYDPDTNLPIYDCSGSNTTAFDPGNPAPTTFAPALTTTMAPLGNDTTTVTDAPNTTTVVPATTTMAPTGAPNTTTVVPATTTMAPTGAPNTTTVVPATTTMAPTGAPNTTTVAPNTTVAVVTTTTAPTTPTVAATRTLTAPVLATPTLPLVPTRTQSHPVSPPVAETQTVPLPTAPPAVPTQRTTTVTIVPEDVAVAPAIDGASGLCPGQTTATLSVAAIHATPAALSFAWRIADESTAAIIAANTTTTTTTEAAAGSSTSTAPVTNTAVLSGISVGVAIRVEVAVSAPGFNTVTRTATVTGTRSFADVVTVPTPVTAATGSTTAYVEISIPATATVAWSKISGAGDIARVNGKAGATVEGVGTVRVLVSVADSTCGLTEYRAVDVIFAAAADAGASCDAATTCTGNGVCDPSNPGACSCFQSPAFGYFAGLRCNRCADGYVGSSCNVFTCASTTCGSHGACSTTGSGCVCHRNSTHGFWAGDTCSVCLVDPAVGSFAGAECNACVPGYFPPGQCTVHCVDAKCSGHGKCGSAGTCVCSASTAEGFWTGSRCTSCAGSYGGVGCNETCQDAVRCSGHGTCVARIVAGAPGALFSCACSTGWSTGWWSGSTCNACAADFGGSLCRTFSSTNATVISARRQSCLSSCGAGGTCNTVGTCVCSLNAQNGFWTGPECNSCANSTSTGFWAAPGCRTCRRGYAGSSCTVACPSLCNGHGTCRGESVSSASCVCDASALRGFWQGATCGACQAGWAGANCNVRCVPGSTCLNGACDAATGRCACFANASHGFFSGSSCDRCLSAYASASNCTACAPGYFGPSCIRCTAEETCSGHGTCNAAGSCTCSNSTADGGVWAGDACSVCAPGYLPPSCLISEAELLGGADLEACANATAVAFRTAIWRDGFVGISASLERDMDANATEAAGGSSSDCREIFAPETALLLGTDFACAWVNLTTFTVTFGGDFTAVHNTNFSILPASILGTTGDAACPIRAVGAASFVAALPSAGSQSIDARIAVPTTVSSCEDLVIDASASSAPSPRVHFSVVALDDTVSDALRAAVAALVFDTSRVATIPTWALTTAATHRFAVRLEDLITGLVDEEAFSVFVSAAAPPSVVIRGPPVINVSVTRPLTLFVDATPSPCAVASAAQLRFVWRITATGTNPPAVNTSINLHSGTLSFPARSLEPGTYTVGVNVSAPDTNATAPSLPLTLVVTPAPVVPTLVVPTVLVSASADLVVKWKCTEKQGFTRVEPTALTCVAAPSSPCVAAAFASALQQSLVNATYASANGVTSGVAVLPGGTWSTGAGAFQIALQCAAGQTAVASVNVSTAAVSSPAFLLEATPATGIVAAGSKFAAVITTAAATSANASAELTRVGATYSWSCAAPCSLDLTDLETAPMGSNHSAFVIDYDALAVGTYTFTCNITETKGSAVGTVTLLATTLNVVPAPALGTVAVSTRTHAPMGTVAVTAGGWVPGHPSLLPLTYAVEAFTESGTRTVLAAAAAATTRTVRIPSTGATDDVGATTTLLLVVTDASGGVTEVQATVTQVRGAVDADALARDIALAAVSDSAAGVLALIPAAASASITSAALLAAVQAAATSGAGIPSGLGPLALEALNAVTSSPAPAASTEDLSPEAAAALLAQAMQQQDRVLDLAMAATLDELQVLDRPARTAAKALALVGRLSANAAVNQAAVAQALARAAAAAAAASNVTGGAPAATAAATSISDVVDPAVAAAEAQKLIALQGSVMRVLSAMAVDGEGSTLQSSTASAVTCRRSAAGGAMPTDGGESIGFSSSSGDAGAVPSDPDGGESADLCSMAVSTNLYAGADPNATTASGTLTVDLRSSASGGVIPVDNDDSTAGNRTVRFSIPLVNNSQPQAASSNNGNSSSEGDAVPTQLRCSFFNRTSNAFETSGCVEVSVTDTSVVCECTHLTEFSVTVNKIDVGNFEDIKLAAIIYLCTLAAIFIVALPLAYGYDVKRQTRYVDDIWADDAAQAALLAEIRVALHEAPTNALQRIRDAPEVFDAVRARDFNMGWHRTFIATLLTDHPWVAPFGGHPSSDFSVPQRLLVLYVLIVAQMLCSGIFFDPNERSLQDSIVQVIAATLVSVPIAIIAAELTAFPFKNSVRSDNDARYKTHRQHLGNILREADREEKIRRDALRRESRRARPFGEPSSSDASDAFDSLSDTSAAGGDPWLIVPSGDAEAFPFGEEFDSDSDDDAATEAEKKRKLDAILERRYRGDQDLTLGMVCVVLRAMRHRCPVPMLESEGAFDIIVARALSEHRAANKTRPLVRIGVTRPPSRTPRAGGNKGNSGLLSQRKTAQLLTVDFGGANPVSAMAQSTRSAAPFDATLPCKIEVGLPPPGCLSLLADEVAQVAASFSSGRRHLIAISLHALAAGQTLTSLGSLNGTRRMSPVDATRLLRSALGCEGSASVDVTDRTIHTLRSSTSLPDTVMNVVMQAYLGVEDPRTATFFATPADDPTLVHELYADEMHSCAWRLAIECVKEREMALAEALFTMHLLLEHPDLYLVLFNAAVPRSTAEVLDTVCRICAPGTAGSPNDHFFVGRMWAALYASHLLRLDAVGYSEQHGACSAVTPRTLACLLGLHEPHQAIIAGGCTPHALQIETCGRVPKLTSVAGLVEPHSSSAVLGSPFNVKPVKRGAFESLVHHAHALRLIPKPFLDQRPDASVEARVAMACAGAANTAPEDAAAAGCLATRRLNRMARGWESSGAEEGVPNSHLTGIIDERVAQYRSRTDGGVFANHMIKHETAVFHSYAEDHPVACHLVAPSDIVRDVTRAGSPYCSSLLQVAIRKIDTRVKNAIYSPTDISDLDTAAEGGEADDDADAAVPEDELAIDDVHEDDGGDEGDAEAKAPEDAATVVPRVPTHTNFYATIEYGRLLACLNFVMKHTNTYRAERCDDDGNPLVSRTEARTALFDDFARRYLDECADLSSKRGFSVKLKRGAASWLDSVAIRNLDRGDAVLGNNFFNAGGRTYPDGIITERAAVQQLRDDEKRRQEELEEAVRAAAAAATAAEAGGGGGGGIAIAAMDDHVDSEAESEDSHDDAMAKTGHNGAVDGVEARQRRKDDRTIAKSRNRAARAHGFADPVLHCLISVAVREGSLWLPKGASADVLYDGTSRATIRFAMPAVSANAAASLRNRRDGSGLAGHSGFLASMSATPAVSPAAAAVNPPSSTSLQRSAMIPTADDPSQREPLAGSQSAVVWVVPPQDGNPREQARSQKCLTASNALSQSRASGKKAERDRRHHRLTSRLSALAGICRFHPQTAAGLGTPTTPHVGITSACSVARMGSRVVLLPGHYRPASLQHLHGCMRYPLIVCPVGYHRALQHKAQRLGLDGDADDVPVTSPPTAKAAANAPDAIEIAHAVAPFGGRCFAMASTDERDRDVGASLLLRTPLSEEEAAMVLPVTVSHESASLTAAPKQAGLGTPSASTQVIVTRPDDDADVEPRSEDSEANEEVGFASHSADFDETPSDDETDEDDICDDGLEAIPLVDFDNCSFVSLLGLHFVSSETAIAARDSTSVFARHSWFRNCGLAYTSTDWQMVVPVDGNDLGPDFNHSRQQFAAQLLPSWLRFPGYALALVLFLFFAFMCLFLTSALSDDDANAWIIQCAITFVAVGFMLQPAQISGKATMRYVLAATAGASAQLNGMLSFV